MLTWKLWRALNRAPQGSRLYRRAYSQEQSPRAVGLIRLPLVGVLKNAGLVALPILLILLGVPLLVPLYTLLLLAAPILLPIANTIYGTVLAVSVSGSIARERDRRTYDVLCTVPAGTLGLHWSYCTGWIYFHAGYRRVLLGILSIGIVASIFGLSPRVVFGVEPVSSDAALVRGLVLGGIYVIDYAQTLVVSGLVAMIMPTYAETESNARLWATSLFLGLQIAVYLPTLLLASFALPNTLALMGLAPTVADMVTPLLLVFFFAALRALMIAGLWQRVKAQPGVTAMELDGITRLAV